MENRRSLLELGIIVPVSIRVATYAPPKASTVAATPFWLS